MNCYKSYSIFTRCGETGRGRTDVLVGSIEGVRDWALFGTYQRGMKEECQCKCRKEQISVLFKSAEHLCARRLIEFAKCIISSLRRDQCLCTLIRFAISINSAMVCVA